MSEVIDVSPGNSWAEILQVPVTLLMQRKLVWLVNHWLLSLLPFWWVCLSCYSSEPLPETSSSTRGCQGLFFKGGYPASRTPLHLGGSCWFPLALLSATRDFHAWRVACPEGAWSEPALSESAVAHQGFTCCLPGIWWCWALFCVLNCHLLIFFSYLSHIFAVLFVFWLLIISHRSPLSDVGLQNVLPICGLSFHSLSNFAILMKSKCSISRVVDCAFGGVSGRSLSNPRSWHFLFYFLSLEVLSSSIFFLDLWSTLRCFLCKM